MAEGDKGDITNLCIRCKKPVGTGVRCLRCGTLSHKSCLKSLKHVTFFENNTCHCCPLVAPKTCPLIHKEMETNKTQNDMEIEMYRQKVQSLEIIIKEKDNTIKFQDVAIKSLNDQINLLKSVNIMFKNANHIQNEPPTSSTNHEINNSLLARPAITSNNLDKGNNFDTNEIKGAIHTAQTKQKCDELINLQKGNEVSALNLEVKKSTKSIQQDKFKTSNYTHTLDETTTSSNNPPKPKNILVGNGVFNEECPFKAASFNSHKHFHVTNIEVDVGEKSLQEYLMNFAPDVKVLKINSRNPRYYSSFKVSVPVNQVENLLNSAIWPNGTIVNHFFYSKRLHQIIHP